MLVLIWNTKGRNELSGGTQDYEKVLYYPCADYVVFLESVV